jgi:hypothetical protein
MAGRRNADLTRTPIAARGMAIIYNRLAGQDIGRIAVLSNGIFAAAISTLKKSAAGADALTYYLACRHRARHRLRGQAEQRP